MMTRLLLGLTTVCALTGASACGGVATQDKGTGTASCNEIRIGAPYPLTGGWADNGTNSLQGMELAADKINAAGGIKSLGGAKIKIISADTSSDNPGQAKSVTERMLQERNMSAVVGSFLSSMTLTVAIATEKAEVPLVTQSLVDDLTQKGYKYLFQIAPKASQYGSLTVSRASEVFKAQGRTLKTIAVAGSDDASSKVQADSVAKNGKSQGVEVVANVTFPNELQDASPVVSALARGNPDLVAIMSNLPNIALIIKGLRSQGVQAAVIGSAGVLTPQFSTTLGPNAEGVMAIAAWNSDLSFEGVKEVAAAYKAKNNVFMPQEAGESWVAVNELAQLMESDKTCDPRKLRDALASTEFTTGNGAAMPPGSVAYDAKGANKTVQPVLVQWQNGELRTIAPPKSATTTPRQLPAS